MQTETINYVPHWGVLTEEGRTHFHTVSQAIMEHVDNSINVLAMNSPEVGRHIEVLIYMPVREMEVKEEPGMLVIFDNGCGMSKEQLEAYFTTALGRKRRGLEPRTDSFSSSPHSHLTSSLSKFGVGALQSFAYLGTRLKVITKAKGERELRSYCIDPDSFEKKETEGGRAEAYRGQVLKSKKPLDFLDERDRKYSHLQEHLKKSTESRPHFTYIMITLNEMSKLQLVRDRGVTLVRDLSDAYYYYLKPSALADFGSGAARVMGGGGSMQKKQKGRGGLVVARGGGGSGGQSSSSGGGASSSSAADGGEESTEASVVDIAVYYVRGFGPNPKVYMKNLVEELPNCLEGMYLSQAEGEPFVGTFEIDDPTTVRTEDESAINTDQPCYVATVVCRYFPYRDHKETRPIPANVYLLETDDSNSLSDDEDVLESNSSQIISVRWQTRKLPEAKYSRLPMFPPENTNKPDSPYGQWRNRLHITLFIRDWDFPVSNNKLTVQGAFDEVLSNPKRIRPTERNLPTKFQEWLKTYHSEYDRTFTLETEMSEVPPGIVPKVGAKYFQHLRFGSKDVDVWQEGEAIQIQIGKGKKRGRGATSFSAPASGPASGKGNERHLGVILCFEEQGLDRRVYYARVPHEIFMSDIKWAAVTALDCKTSKMTKEMWESACEGLKKRRPKLIEVVKWDGVDRTSRGPMPDLDTEEGSSLPVTSLLVGLKDYTANWITESNSPLPKLFIARLAIKNRLTSNIVHSFTSDTVVDSSSFQYYPFQIPAGLTLPVGRYQLIATALQTNNPQQPELMSKTFAFDVRAAPTGPPAEIEVEGLDCLTFPVNEEVPLPAFSIRLKDKRGRLTHCESIMVEMLVAGIPGFDVEYRGSNKQKKVGSSKKRRKGGDAADFSIAVGEELEGLSFGPGDFVAVLVTGAEPMLSAVRPQVMTKQCTLTVTCGDEEFTSVRSLTVAPGRPVKLVLDSPERLTTRPIDNRSSLPELLIRPIDAGGNVTAPGSSQRWGVTIVQPEGLELVPRKAGLPKEVTGMGEILLSDLQVVMDLSKEKRRGAGGAGSNGYDAKQVTVDVRVALPRESGASSSSSSPSLSLEIPFSVRPRRGHPVRAFLDFRGRAEGQSRAEEVSFELTGKSAPPSPAEVCKQEVEAGTVFTHVQMRILDEMGDTIEMGRVQGEITISWESSVGRTFRVAQLPKLVVPTSSSAPQSDRYFTAQGTFSWAPASKVSFHFAWEFTVVASSPKLLWFHPEWNTAVQSGVPFSHPTSPITFRDQYKNLIKAGPDLPVPEIAYREGKDLTILPKAVLPATLDPVTGQYFVKDKITITGKAPQGFRVRVQLNEKNAAIKVAPVRYDINLGAGPPTEMLLGRTETSAAGFSKSLDMRLCQGELVSNLVAELWDSGCTNRAKVMGDNCSLEVYVETMRGGKSQQTLLASLKLVADSSGPYGVPSFCYPANGDRTLFVMLRQGNQTLCRAELKCAHYKVNRVISLQAAFAEVEGGQLLHRDVEDNGMLKVRQRFQDTAKAMTSWTVDSSPPALVVRFETEDAAELALTDLPPGALSVSIARDGGHSMPPLSWYDKWEICREEPEGDGGGGGGVLAVWMPSTEEKMEAGGYKATVTYVEHRQGIKAVTEVSQLQRDVARGLHVRPGKAVALGPKDALPQSRTATNRADDQEARKVLEAATFEVVDRTGAPTAHQGHAHVVIRAAEGLEGGAEGVSGDLPRLANADGHGRVASRRVEKAGGLTEYRFTQLYLSENVGNRPGTYSLCFNITGLTPYRKEFSFVTDSLRIKEIEAKKAQLSPLQQEEVKHQAQLKALSQALVEFSSRAKPLFRNVAAVYDENQLRAEGVRTNELEALEQYLKQKEQEAGSARRCRKPHGYPPPGIGEIAPDNYGFVFEIGHVKDRRTAELLSWYASQKSMKALVVPLNVDYENLRENFRSVPVYSLEDTLEAKCAVQENGQLNLPDVRAKGFVDYAVNAIELKPGDEKFRRTVFWDIFGFCMLFNTEADAMAYRKTNRQKRNPMLTLQECRRIQAKGPLDGEDRMTDDDAKRVPFVFGELPATETKQYQKSKQLYKDLGALHEVLVAEAQTRADLDRLGKDPAAVTRQQKISQIGASINQLMRPTGR